MGCFDKLSLRLESADYLFNLLELVLAYEVNLIYDNRVTELNLLDDEVLDVLLVDIVGKQSSAAAELGGQPRRVNNGNDVVKTAKLGDFGVVVGAVEHSDCLCNRNRLADSRCLDEDIIKLVHLNERANLLDKVGFESTADTAVLERNEVIILFLNDSALLNQLGVDVHLAYIVDDNGNLVALLVGEDVVEQSCLACSEVTCK